MSHPMSVSIQVDVEAKARIRHPHSHCVHISNHHHCRQRYSQRHIFVQVMSCISQTEDGFICANKVLTIRQDKPLASLPLIDSYWAFVLSSVWQESKRVRIVQDESPYGVIATMSSTRPDALVPSNVLLTAVAQCSQRVIASFLSIL